MEALLAVPAILVPCNTALGPWVQIDFGRKLAKVVDFHVHQLRVVELKTFEVNDQSVLGVFQKLPTLRLNQPIMLVALVLVLSFEHVRFDPKVKRLLETCLSLNVKTEAVKGLLPVGLVRELGL